MRAAATEIASGQRIPQCVRRHGDRQSVAPVRGSAVRCDSSNMRDGIKQADGGGRGGVTLRAKDRHPEVDSNVARQSRRLRHVVALDDGGCSRHAGGTRICSAIMAFLLQATSDRSGLSQRCERGMNCCRSTCANQWKGSARLRGRKRTTSSGGTSGPRLTARHDSTTLAWEMHVLQPSRVIEPQYKYRPARPPSPSRVIYKGGLSHLHSPNPNCPRSGRRECNGFACRPVTSRPARVSMRTGAFVDVAAGGRSAYGRVR